MLIYLIVYPVPLVSRVCPSDVCRVWKSGASLRVDATLLGFENMTWIRGRRSYIFRGDGECLPVMPLRQPDREFCSGFAFCFVLGS